MKKINLIVFAFVLLAFSQCKKSKDTEQPQSGKFDIKCVVETGNSKNIIDDTGHITWLMSDKFYFFNDGSTSVLEVEKVEGEGTTHRASLEGSIDVNYHGYYGYPQYAYRDIIYMGSKGELNGNTLSLSLAEQTGLPADIGNTHVMLANKCIAKREEGGNNYEYIFDNSVFLSYNAIARVDLSKYDGQTIRIYYDYVHGYPNSVPTTLEVSARTPIYELVDGMYTQRVQNQSEIHKGDYITITQPSGNTYVSLLPEKDSDIQAAPVNLIFKTVNGSTEAEVGRIQLPYVYPNYFYTGPDYAPITLETGDGAKSVVVATEMK